MSGSIAPSIREKESTGMSHARKTTRPTRQIEKSAAPPEAQACIPGLVSTHFPKGERTQRK